METILISIRDFLELGGTVLTVIALVTGLLWVLVLERIYYLKFHHPKIVKKALTLWQVQDHSEPWFTQKLKQRLMSLVSLKLERNLALIKTLIAVCPLLGLLGTVTGMLEVFEVMSFTGTGNARAMASGVSKATVPTMAGMVTASVWHSGDHLADAQRPKRKTTAERANAQSGSEEPSAHK